MDIGRILALLFPSSCTECGAMGSALCDACLGMEGPILFEVSELSCAAIGLYQGVLRSSVLHMKKGRRDVGERLGEILANRIGATFGSRPCLAPVPTTNARRRERGFDQAELLARVAADHLQGHSVRLLERVGGLSQQGGSRSRRLRAMGRFTVRADAQPYPAGVVLVDDVVTTGATLLDAVRTLEGAGVAVRGALAVARADA